MRTTVGLLPERFYAEDFALGDACGEQLVFLEESFFWGSASLLGDGAADFFEYTACAGT